MQALLYLLALLFLFMGGFAALPNALPSARPAEDQARQPLVRLTPVPAIARYVARYKERWVRYAGVAPLVPSARTSPEEGSAHGEREEAPAAGAARTAPAPAPRTPTYAAAPEGALSPQEILVATNNEREKRGVMPLAWNAALAAMAERKARDILMRQYFDHVAPTGEGIADLAQEEGYAYLTLAENLALGEFSSSQAVVDAWMESEGHRANILNPSLREIGVGVARGRYEGTWVWVAVQEFGTPRSVCPEPNDALRAAIDARDKDLAAALADITRIKEMLDALGADDPTYPRLVETYNKAAARYNALLAAQKKDVALYNQGVRAYNICLQREAGVPTGK